MDSERTEVFLLCLTSLKCLIPASMYVKCGTQTRTRTSISSEVGAVGGETLQVPNSGLHAFIGFDTVSAFAGRGKITARRRVKQQTSYQEMFKQLGMNGFYQICFFRSLQEFTCKLYCSQSRLVAVCFSLEISAEII